MTEHGCRGAPDGAEPNGIWETIADLRARVEAL